MFDHIPAHLGRALRGLRAGHEKVVSERPEFADAPRFPLESRAFACGGIIPERYTADGAKISPPLEWRDLPQSTKALALVVEDADAPTHEPLVHLLAWNLPPEAGGLPEGEFRSPHFAGVDEMLGRSAHQSAAYLPPGPPSGHGAHAYTFQVFALNRMLDFGSPPSRTAVVKAMRGHVQAKGVLVGLYARA